MAVPPAKTGKAAPFRRRVEDSLDAARAKGFAEVTITTADGAEYRFKLAADTAEPVEARDDDPIGERLRLWKAHEAHAKPKVR